MKMYPTLERVLINMQLDKYREGAIGINFEMAAEVKLYEIRKAVLTSSSFTDHTTVGSSGIGICRSKFCPRCTASTPFQIR